MNKHRGEKEMTYKKNIHPHENQENSPSILSRIQIKRLVQIKMYYLPSLNAMDTTCALSNQQPYIILLFKHDEAGRLLICFISSNQFISSQAIYISDNT